ncbi:heme uptake protein IsdC [Paenibacillus piri]|uniref:heme uptake protein IsdC n=1 Tax=Paenibacillus piri TaxID=2547395 RepID=UPI0014054288|nr:heme uptake protein IsdC [Paenibacillus piri]
MKKHWDISIYGLLLLCLLTLFIQPGAQAAAAVMSDGTYILDYTIKQADSDSVSMANDYFEKPATVVVTNGEARVQLQMNHSKWITVFKVPNGSGFADANVVSHDSAADTRVVGFKVDDLTQPVLSKIHVTVESINYDHDYTIRFAFDTKSVKPAADTGGLAPTTSTTRASSLPANGKPADAAPQAESGQGSGQASAKAAASKAEAASNDQPIAAETEAAKKQAVSNPKTGDATPLGWLIAIVMSSAFLLACCIKIKKSL